MGESADQMRALALDDGAQAVPRQCVLPVPAGLGDDDEVGEELSDEGGRSCGPLRLEEGLDPPRVGGAQGAGQRLVHVARRGEELGLRGLAAVPRRGERQREDPSGGGESPGLAVGPRDGSRVDDPSPRRKEGRGERVLLPQHGPSPVEAQGSQGGVEGCARGCLALGA